jgi:DNA topoisomerase-2
VPLLLLNGSNGISVGYSQKILPRRLDDLIRAVALRLKGKPVDRIAPYYKGFKGTIEKTDVENQWRITGTFERQTKTQIVVTELPVGYDLKGYVDVLERLEESGKIRAYADESENDQFRFVIGLSREIGSGSDEELISLLKLSKNVSENFTAIDTENRVQDFKNEIDIIDYWLKVRLQYNDLRKASMLKKIQEQIVDLTMKRRFIGAVLDHKIIIERRSKNDILDQMKTFDSAMFEYNTSNNLLNMPLWSITEERISELDDKISKTEENRKTIEETSLEDMVVQDLKTIKLPKGL